MLADFQLFCQELNNKAISQGFLLLYFISWIFQLNIFSTPSALQVPPFGQIYASSFCFVANWFALGLSGWAWVWTAHWNWVSSPLLTQLKTMISLSQELTIANSSEGRDRTPWISLLLTHDCWPIHSYAGPVQVITANCGFIIAMIVYCPENGTLLAFSLLMEAAPSFSQPPRPKIIIEKWY